VPLGSSTVVAYIYLAIDGAAAADFADFRVVTRPEGGLFVGPLVLSVTGRSSPVQVSMVYPAALSEKMDLVVRVTRVSSNNMQVSAALVMAQCLHTLFI